MRTFVGSPLVFDCEGAEPDTRQPRPVDGQNDFIRTRPPRAAETRAQNRILEPLRKAGNRARETVKRCCLVGPSPLAGEVAPQGRWGGFPAHWGGGLGRPARQPSPAPPRTPPGRSGSQPPSGPGGGHLPRQGGRALSVDVRSYVQRLSDHLLG